MSTNGHPRILLGPPGTLDQCVLSFPLLCALRDQFPEAFLAWAVDREFAPLVQGHPCLDRLLELPPDWNKSLRCAYQLYRQLQSLRLELALDSQGTVSSAMLVWLSRTPVRVTRRGRWSNWFHNPHVTARSDRWPTPWGLLEHWGITSPHVRFAVPRDPAAEARVQAFVRAAHLSCGFWVMCPGDGPGSWPVQRYGHVARTLGQRHRITAVVVEAERLVQGALDRLISNSGGHAIVAPWRTLPECVSLLRDAEFLLSCQAGQGYLAASLGTPAVCVCRAPNCDTSEVFAASLAWMLPPPTASAASGPNPGDAIWDVSCETVCQECERLLDGGDSHVVPAA